MDYKNPNEQGTLLDKCCVENDMLKSAHEATVFRPPDAGLSEECEQPPVTEPCSMAMVPVGSGPRST